MSCVGIASGVALNALCGCRAGGASVSVAENFAEGSVRRSSARTIPLRLKKLGGA